MSTSDFVLHIQPSRTGEGLFAGERIPKDAYIIEYTGEIISDEEANRRNNAYIFDLENGFNIDGSDRRNTARFVNHSCKPNCYAELDEDERRIYILADRVIKPGEELFINYGSDHFDEFIKPGGCKCPACSPTDQHRV